MRRTWRKSLVFIERKMFLLGLSVLLCTGCSRGSDTSELTEITEDLSVTEEKADTGESAGENTSDKTDGVSTDSRTMGSKAAGVCVHVCGAVGNPGVYRLPPDSRLYEAIEAAGGLREEADDTSLNQAATVADGQQIYVPTKEEVESGTFGGASGGDTETVSEVSEGKININTAEKEQLMTLRGIGESKAAAIITYRETNGQFRSIEELMEIDGIKEGVFQKIRDRITI